MAFLQGTDGNDVLGETKLDEQLLGPGAMPALLAMAAVTTFSEISCQFLSFPF
jgi:hypothetical protein